MRKYTLFMGAVTISAMAAGCGSNRGQESTVGTSGTNGGHAMTLRGCVEPGSPAGTYVLRTSASPKAGGDTAGTGGSRERSGANVNGAFENQREGFYRLIATGNLDIGQNVHKEVTVTGEVARPAQDNGTTGTTGPGGRPTTGAAGESGPAGNSGAAANTGQTGPDRTNRRTTGEGDNGTNLQSGSSQGSGNGRIQGSASDESASGQFFRVTSLTRVSDNCGSGESADDHPKDQGRQRR